MTTIAFDGLTLAGDRQCTYGSTPTRTRSKVCRITAPDGRKFLVGTSGLSAEAGAFKAWLRGDIKKRPDFTELGALVIDAQHRIWLYTEKTHGYERIHACCWALGCGADYALGAMYAGADAVTAVKIAAKLDVHTGMGVTAVRFAKEISP